MHVFLMFIAQLSLLISGRCTFQANIAMHEAMSLDSAVETALKMTNREDTLIIVTADHGHTMEMTGYQSRGSDIRGKSVSRKYDRDFAIVKSNSETV
jgi:alkaline phosphatase